MDQTIGAILYTAEAVLAQTVQGIGHQTGIQPALVINPINTFPLDALGAFKTTLFPGNDPGPYHGGKTAGHRGRVNMIFRWHDKTSVNNLRCTVQGLRFKVLRKNLTPYTLDRFFNPLSSASARPVRRFGERPLPILWP